MRANNVLGLIFTNVNDSLFPELTGIRSMGAVPFGGRYRIIDFHLSNLVNANVDKVGIVPRSSYRSLMDHIGAGKAWDLDRKQGGLSFLPPYIIGSGSGTYKGHMDAIKNIGVYLSKSKEEYVILCDADVVCNIDFKDMIKQFKASGADIAVAFKNGKMPKYAAGHLVCQFDDNNIANDVIISTEAGKECNYSLGIMIFRKEQLIDFAVAAYEHGNASINRSILFEYQQRNLKIFGYEVKGFAAVIDGIASYTKASMDILNKDIRKDLFNPARPVFTKTRDDMPTKYGLDSVVKNSVLGEGCVVEGTVENCILFRGVKVGKGAVVKDCILMQETVIEDNCELQYVTADKDAFVSSGTKLCGAENNHYIISKGTKI